MLKTILAFLCLLLLLFPVSAQPVSVLDAGSADITLVIEGSSEESQIVYIPTSSERQEVVFPVGITVIKDLHGNSYVLQEGNYSLTFHVEVDAMKPVIRSDEALEARNEPREFLNDSSVIQPSDPAVSERAMVVTNNSETVLEAIQSLGAWVSEYIEYDQEFEGEMLSCDEIIKARKGVCTEYVTLYTSMARSIGIPTRVVTGVAYSGNSWKRHAWAESLVGDTWVPVDPTYGEIGLKNALSVKLYSAPSYLFYLKPKSVEEVTVTNFNYEGFDLPIKTEASVSETTLAPRQEFYVNLLLTNNGKNILMPTFFVQKYVGIESFDSFRKNVLVRPGDSKSLDWKFLAPFGERKEYLLMLKGPATDETFMVKVDPMLSAKNKSDIEIKEVFATGKNGVLEVEAIVKNTGNRPLSTAVRAYTELGTSQKIVDLQPGDEEGVRFEFTGEAGNYFLVVEASAGNETVRVEEVVEIKEPPTAEKELWESINENMPTLSVLAGIVFLTLIIVVALLLHKSIKRPKTPFEEKGNWHSLLKLE